MKQKDSCNGCTRRHLACWSDCPDYARRKEKRDRERAARYKAKETEKALIEIFARRGTRR